MSTSGEMSTALIAIIGIWSLVGLGFFIWYLAALARLFPKLGLPGWAGWVPLWNEWQLFWRAGLPGWLVLSYLIPGLGIIAVIVRIIAIHRLNTETRHGAGFTVLGAIIPPLWATLLGSELIAASPGHTNAPRSAPPQAQPAAANRSIDEDPWRGLPPVAQPQGAQVQYQQPAAQQAQAQQYQPYQQAPSYEVPEQRPPQPRHVPPHPPVSAGAQDSFSELGISQPRQNPPQQPQYQAPNPPAYSEPQSEQEREDEWGLGLTTEREFERLAAEKLQHPPAAPLAPQPAPQPFSWPGSAGERNSAQDQQQTPEPEPVPEPDLGPGAESAPESNATPTIFDSAPPEAPSIHPAAAPVPPSVTPTSAPSITDSGAASTTATGGEVDSNLNNEVDEDDEFDRTVVVSRKPVVRWALELPDQDRLDLLGDDIVIGRKPSSDDGAELLMIPDPTRTLSKSHARLRLDDDEWTIEDLDSTNGLELIAEDGVPELIEPGTPRVATERMIIGTLEVRLVRVD